MMNDSALRESNPWWIDGALPARYRDTTPRDVLPGLIEALDPRRATVLLGPRRVGKTVLLHQLVGALLSRGVPPERIIYFSADDPVLDGGAKLLDDVLAFHERVVGGAPPLRSLEPLAGKLPSCDGPDLTYVLVDEIHAVPDWPRWVKAYIDRMRPYVWVVTSSASVVMHRGSTESLAGRALTLRLFPFSLAEVATYLASPAEDSVRAASRVWGELGLGPITGERAQALEDVWREAALKTRGAVELSREYLWTGGFPEYLALASPGQLAQDRTFERLRYFPESLVDRVLLLDVPAIADIRNPALMGRLLRHLLTLGPAIINIADIASDLDTTKITISEYLRVIEGTMLDFILDRYAGTEAGRQPGMKKSVPVDPGMVAAMARWEREGPNAVGHEGHLAEVAVHSWLRRREAPGQHLMHWRKRDKEVDFVVRTPGWVLPVEVKWREARKTRGLSGLDEFQRRHGPGTSLTVTRDAFEVRESGSSVPLWMLG